MLSRQLEGIAKAKAEGKYRGGIPTARAKAEQVFTLVDTGKTRAEAAEELRNQHPKRLPHLADSQRCRESASVHRRSRGFGHVRKSAHKRGDIAISGHARRPVSTTQSSHSLLPRKLCDQAC